MIPSSGRLAAVALALAGFVQPVRAQRPSEVALVGPAGAAGPAIPLDWHRGYAAFPLAALRRIGWTVQTAPDAPEAAAARGGARLELRERSPYFRWADTLLQMTGEPYRFGDDLWVPLELLSDFLPGRRPREFAFRGDAPALEVKIAAAWTPESAARLAREAVAPAAVAAPPAEVRSVPRPGPAAPVRPAASGRPTAAESRHRVVVIDAGHGGDDPGARGPNGVREKDVALRIALALGKELERDPDIEVHLTRAGDRLVPLWERGEWATGVKGERPGVFISLHANAETSRAASGFETYFLSEARTEHEKRVAALENEPFQGSGAGPAADRSELNGIVQELRNLDGQHWSSLLAEMVQDEMQRVHPGPNRGVKQAPLAVITNSLMPAVLIEVGFISNRAEERLLDTPKFQADAARAIAHAVHAFFERYPPGAAPAAGSGSAMRAPR